MSLINLTPEFKNIGLGNISKISTGKWDILKPLYYSDYVTGTRIGAYSEDGFCVDFTVIPEFNVGIDYFYKLQNFTISYDNESWIESISFDQINITLTSQDYKNLTEKLEINWNTLLSMNDTVTGSEENDYVNAGSGDDLIDGNDGDDILYGGLGIDQIYGGLGDDLIFGGSGNDSLFGGDGDDFINGESGSDTIYGNDGSDLISGGAGIDYIYCGTGDDTAKGGSGSDTIQADDGENFLYGESGSDLIWGGSDTDYIDGGSNNDILFGNDGDDLIYGGSGDDSIYGDSGDDYINGNSGNDTLDGNDGDDSIFGDSGDDILIGGLGNNHLDGGDGVDTYKFRNPSLIWSLQTDNENEIFKSIIDLKNSRAEICFYVDVDSIESINEMDVLVTYKEIEKTFDELLNIENAYDTDGNDEIYGNDQKNRIYLSSGNNTVSAGAGDDELIIEVSGFNALDGGDGWDIVEISEDYSASKIVLNLQNSEKSLDQIAYAANSLNIDDSQSIILNIQEYQLGNNPNSNIYIFDSELTDEKFTIKQLYSMKWDKWETEELNYSDNDEISFEYSFEYSNEGAYIDAKTKTAGYNSSPESIKFSGVRNFTGSIYDDTINGDDSNNIINGNGGNDILNGRKGIDTLDYSYSTKSLTADLTANKLTIVSVQSGFTHLAVSRVYNFENVWGGINNDSLKGNSLDNSLDGGGGNDKINGRSGNDTISGNNGIDIIDGGAGIDTISFSYITHAVGVNLELGTYNNKNKNTSQTIATINKSDSDKVSNIENIIGSKNSDILTGNSANNVINGAEGADRLMGGLGQDKLYGGSEDRAMDVFIFTSTSESTSAGRDQIFDFVTNIDKIDLSGIDANTASAKTGDQAFLFNNMTAKANSVWYAVKDVDGSTATKDIIVYGDVNGDAKADFEIGLVGVTSLTSADFVL